VRLLLDTHVFLWTVSNDRRLTKRSRKLIQESDEVFVSSASIWESAIKAGMGKLDADIAVLASAIADSGFIELPVRAVHAIGVRTLPNIHRDPFDRMLISQAMYEPLHLLTADRILASYSPLVVMI
jgi:PIN domain nuclease of toxin-antitoxin system